MPRVGSWTLRLMAPEMPSDETSDWDDKNQEVVDKMVGILSSYSGVINLQLPDGYYVKIDDH